MTWQRSYRADDAVRPLADRHYNRQSVGAVQFVKPGRCVVLKAHAPDGSVGAFWITSWPKAAHSHAPAHACLTYCAFRNERADLWLSSDLIVGALIATLQRWEPPPLGMVTFVDPTQTRRKRDPGRCFRKAGFHVVGTTGSGLLALQLLPDEMPMCVLRTQPSLWEAAS